MVIRTAVSSESIDPPYYASTTQRYRLDGYAARCVNRLVAGQAIVGFGWTAAALLVGFATKMLLTRTMAPADLGVVLAAQAFTGLMLVVAELGLPDAVVRYVGADATPDAAPGRTVRAAIGIVSVSALLTSAAALVVLLLWSNDSMSGDAVVATAILIAGAPAFALGDVLGAAYRGVNRLGTKLLLLDVARPGIVVIALLLSPLVVARRAPYIAGLYVAGALLVLACLWLLFNRDPQWRGRNANTPSELLRFGVPIAGAAILSGPLVNSLLPMMLSAWTGSAAVAFYGIALAVQSIAGMPLGIFEQVLVPVWARMAALETPGELARSYQRYATICFSFATGLAVILLANDRALLVLLFGAGYGAADSALKYALLATLFAAWAGPNEAMLRARGLSGSILISRLITAVAGTASAAVLIPQYGLTGAVSAFALAVVVLNVAYGTALYRAARIHPFTVRHAITTLAAIAAIAAAIARPPGFPGAGWVAAHVLAIAIVATNADLQSSLGAVRDRILAPR
ncbi:MAG: oligosaccharide flippase family protein [Vicinamibacterales bacterium]